MLRSLEIKNYRNLRHLTIEKLGRVNLLVGKNNTGKTSVLEAVYLWANYGRFDKIHEILDARDGLSESSSEDPYLRSQALLESLFMNRVSSTRADSVQMNFRNEQSKSSLIFSLYYVETARSTPENEPLSPKKRLVFEVSSDLEVSIISLTDMLDTRERSVLSASQPIHAKNEFIRSNEVRNDRVSVFFDEVVATDWENEVVSALKIIDSRIAKLAFLTDTLSQKRYPVVRLEGNKNRVPLRSMGDGINRILTIILAMVNCENGYLLIDEFENGLHYSVQEKLWEIIFYLAERLNIQVFATTHSLDCVEAFSAILNDGKHDKNAGAMIRLENYEGNIEATVYDADEIQATTRVHVDPR